MAFPKHTVSVISTIHRGIDVALANYCFGSSVILILSAMDAMAYISMPEAQQDVTRTDFISWVIVIFDFPEPNN